MRAWRGVSVAVAIALAAEAAYVVVTLLAKPPRGPASSSYAAGHHGASGFAKLLDRGGHEVRRQRVPLDVEQPDPSDTVVILDGARPDQRELQALRAFVQQGGRLVIAPPEDDWTPDLIGELERGFEPLLACRVLANVPETRGVVTVESSGKPGWRDTGPAVPILGCSGNALAAVAAVGRGRIVLVSDSAVFHNYLLAAKDNAEFALNAVGGVNRDVIFLEHVHGFRAPSGLAALPARWLLAGAIAVMAVLLAVLARRRIVPTKAAPPAADHPRSVHAEAVAERLADIDQGEASAVVRQAARRALTSALGLPPDAPTHEIETAALQRQIADPDDVRLALGHGPDDPAATVAAGRVLATVRSTSARTPTAPSRHG